MIKPDGEIMYGSKIVFRISSGGKIKCHKGKRTKSRPNNITKRYSVPCSSPQTPPCLAYSHTNESHAKPRR
jgi:hypothetical protein